MKISGYEIVWFVIVWVLFFGVWGFFVRIDLEDESIGGFGFVVEDSY